MVIEDKFVVAAPMERTWALITNIPEVSVCLPGVVLTEARADGTYGGHLKVKVGPISTTFNGTAHVTMAEAPGPVTLTVEGKDRLTGSAVTGSMSMSATPVSEQETEITYVMDVNIRGRLGQLAQGVIRDTAKKMSREFADCLTSRLRGNA